jgi:hypothetical protein
MQRHSAGIGVKFLSSCLTGDKRESGNPTADRNASPAFGACERPHVPDYVE